MTPKQGYGWAALHTVAGLFAWMRVLTDQQIFYLVLAIYFTAMAIRYVVRAEQARRRPLSGPAGLD